MFVPGYEADAPFIGFLLATIVLFYGGWLFYSGAFKSLLNKTADMNLLIVLGTGAAYVYSALALFSPDLFPDSMRHVYFEGASVIITFVLLGKVLEERSKAKADHFLKALIEILPQNARIERNGNETEIPADQVAKGDVCLIKAGEKIPADGTVLSGEAEVDNAAVNGEYLPVLKKEGDSVLAGGLNRVGFLKVLAEKPASKSLVAEMVALMKEARSKKPPIGRLADKIASIFVPAVIGIALIVFLIWNLSGAPGHFGFLAAVTVLIISCPCALGLATPISLVSAIGRGAKEGILIKNPEILEAVGKTDIAVFDKTGTLTEGRLYVKDHLMLMGMQSLQELADLEQVSEHPVSQALLRFCEDQGVMPSEQVKAKILPGKGIRSDVLIAGSPEFLAEEGVEFPEAYVHTLLRMRKSGGTVVCFAKDRSLHGIFSLHDSVRSDAKECIEVLKKQGIKTAILSGDHKDTVEKVGEALGIKSIYAQVLPTEKHALIQSLRQKGKRVLFVGDGINDAAALKEADVGIALSSGTDLAREAGDILLVNNALIGVPNTIQLSKGTLRNIRQNLFWAYVYNLCLIPVAGGILYPFYGILLQPAFAGIAMSFSSVTVVLNALRLNRLPLFKPGQKRYLV